MRSVSWAVLGDKRGRRANPAPNAGSEGFAPPWAIRLTTSARGILASRAPRTGLSQSLRSSEAADSQVKGGAEGEGAKMNPMIKAVVITGLLLVLPAPVYARAPGNPQAGKAVAQEVCAACHAIDVDKGPSPNPKAPAFILLAQMPGMTAVALRAGLQTSHRTMPNIALRQQKREDVIAYILSLK